MHKKIRKFAMKIRMMTIVPHRMVTVEVESRKNLVSIERVAVTKGTIDLTIQMKRPIMDDDKITVVIL